MTNENVILPPKYLRNLLEDVIGKKSTHWIVPDCGLSSALRFSVQFEDKSRVFVKAATDEETEGWLRIEHFVLSSACAEFMPYVIEWVDMPSTLPVLITQDLSHAYWPASHNGVAWRDGDFDLLFSRIKQVASHEAPAALPGLQNRKVSLWSQIANRPDGFLNLRICSEGWLSRSVDALIDAETNADVTGNCLVHGDVRSDNICILDSKPIFVDWSNAARGYALHDQATLLPTLHMEGGPRPYLVMPDGGREAASGSAMHIQRLMLDRSMPEWLKIVFTQIIAIELEWAAQCLGLDEPDGI